MKRKQTLFRLTLVIAVLASVSIAMAVIPPPPVDQNLGLYDTVCAEFNESDCRSCHTSGVPDAHHMLVEEGKYNCTDCHPPGPDGGVTAIRDCTVCHTSTPHHETDAAIDRHCSDCHGSFVDDYDDGHYIPTYDESLITPTTGYRVINETTGKKWGGCEACHEPDPSMDPVIESNSVTHHSAVWNMTCGVNNNICHFGPEPTIRKCEDCHGVNSIHNIQYDYENTSGELGYGHIGADWDCMGCHGWYEFKTEKPPGETIIVPKITEIIYSNLVAGEKTEITVIGKDLMTTVDGTTYSSKVIVESDNTNMTLAPTTITPTKLVVTTPELIEGSYRLNVIKAGLRSKRLPFVVARKLKIDSARIEGDKVIVEGFGFSEYNSSFDEWLGVTVQFGGKEQTKTHNTEILVWTPNKIEAKITGTGLNGIATIDTLYGSQSVRVTSEKGPGRPGGPGRP